MFSKFKGYTEISYIPSLSHCFYSYLLLYIFVQKQVTTQPWLAWNETLSSRLGLNLYWSSDLPSKCWIACKHLHATGVFVSLSLLTSILYEQFYVLLEARGKPQVSFLWVIHLVFHCCLSWDMVSHWDLSCASGSWVLGLQRLYLYMLTTYNLKMKLRKCGLLTIKKIQNRNKQKPPYE